MVVILYKSGIAVNLTENFHDLLFHVEGFILQFSYYYNSTSTKRYVYYSKSQFIEIDQKISNLTDGYYDEKQFLKYIENVGPDIPTATDMILKHQYHMFCPPL